MSKWGIQGGRTARVTAGHQGDARPARGDHMNRSARIAVVVLAAVAAAGMAHAQSVGPDSAATVVNDSSIGTIPWGGPTNAQGTSDGVFAFAGVGSGATSNYLKATNFGFSLP